MSAHEFTVFNPVNAAQVLRRLAAAIEDDQVVVDVATGTFSDRPRGFMDSLTVTVRGKPGLMLSCYEDLIKP